MSYLEIATPLADKSIPTIPLRPKTKIAILPEWEKLATTDPFQMVEWDDLYPDANVGCVALAKSDGVWFFDCDNADVIRRIEAETGKTIPLTFQVQSSPGKNHFYFKQSSASLKMGNIAHKDWSARVSNQYVCGPNSIHPTTGLPYEVVSEAPLIECPEWLIEWMKAQKEAKTPATIDGPKIPRGQHDTTLARIAGKLRRDGLEEDSLATALIEVCEKRCENYGDDYHQMCRKIAKSVCRYPPASNDVLLIINGNSVPPVLNTTGAVSEANEPEEAEDAIPEFDPSVVNGIYARFVELVTRGTTLSPQFPYVIAKTVVGARMAGNVTFGNLDVEPRYYTALIGETGSGKGEAWRRTFQILQPEGGLTSCKIKIINSADSGAGIKDYFFQIPEEQPVLCYVDEIESLGNKSKDTRNPGILDTMIELADCTSVSRVLAKRQGGGSKTKNDARFSMVMCGQDGLTYTKALAGRTKLGLWDRFYPEFGVPQETGDLPPVNRIDAAKLLAELNALDYSGTMEISAEAKAVLDEFWGQQSGEVRKKARWKKNLILDAYMSAFGRGVRTVEPGDVEIAVKIFTRQLTIRRVCFSTEVPDRVGYYLGLIKKITEGMTRRLAAGIPPDQVAKGRRDYERETHAHRDNETHIFERAWNVHHPVWLTKVKIKRANGREYEKFLPAEE